MAYVKENTHTHILIFTHIPLILQTPYIDIYTLHKHIHTSSIHLDIHIDQTKPHTYIPPSPPYTLHITYKPQTYEKFFLSKVVDLPKANDPYVLPSFSLLHVLHFNANLFILLNSFSHYTETPIIPDSMGT